MLPTAKSRWNNRASGRHILQEMNVFSTIGRRCGEGPMSLGQLFPVKEGCLNEMFCLQRVAFKRLHGVLKTLEAAFALQMRSGEFLNSI
ncbi:hypothetical protein OA90_13300 [Labrenzia sp. OB1]|nr:hypothetical protein OA90_13300 [Labrenzia sp. OB1]